MTKPPPALHSPIPVSNSYPRPAAPAPRRSSSSGLHADVHSEDPTQDGFFAQILVCVWLYVSTSTAETKEAFEETNGALVQGISKELYGDVLGVPDRGEATPGCGHALQHEIRRIRGYQFSNTVICGVGSYGDRHLQHPGGCPTPGEIFPAPDRLLTTSITLEPPSSSESTPVGTVSFSDPTTRCPFRRTGMSKMSRTGSPFRSR